MKQRSISLQALLALVFAFLALGLTVSVSMTAERIAAAHLRGRIGRELSSYADNFRDRLDIVMSDNLQLVQTMAALGQRVSADHATWRSWIDSVQTTRKEYAWLGFADVDGVVRASSGGLLEGKSVAQRPWFRSALRKPYAGDVHEALLLAEKLPPEPGGEPIRFVDVSTAVHDTNGRLVGVLGGHMSWRWARHVERDMLSSVEERKSGIEGLILREDGEVLLGPPDLVGHRLDPAILSEIKARSTDRSPSSAPVSSAPIQWEDGQSYLVSASRSHGVGDYSGMDWTVVVRQPARVAFAPVSALSNTILLWGGALTLPFGLLGLLIARRTTRPLLDLVAFAHRHRMGEGGQDVPSGGYSEANALSSSLQRLISDLTARDTALEASNRALEHRVEERTRALNEASIFTQKIIENTPDVILVADPMGRIEFASRALHWLPNAPEATALNGRRLLSLFPSAGVQALQAAMLHACEVPSAEVEIFCPADGAPGKWLSVLVGFMNDGHNQLERVLCIVRDTTIEHERGEEERAATVEAQRLKTEAVAASEAKTDFLASMSHEIRTPLNAVIGFTGIILDRPDLQPDLARQIRMIQSSGNALLTVVNDVLDFSKIESGAIELEPRPFCVRALAENALSIVATLAREKQIGLDLDLDPAISPWLMGDEDRLRQVMLNLLNNAVKFTLEGSVTLRLRRSARTEDCERVVVEVCDTGIGIAPDKIDRLFKRFSQVDGSIRREFGGTGLGLAISQRLVGLMGGEISVASEPWKGTTFSFALSLGLAEAGGADEGTMEPASHIAATPRRLLLAEDLPANQEIARIILESAGHTVDVVDDGASAVRAVESTDYDAVLMDIQMPIMDGLTATAEIRRLSGSRSGLPIIALTANVLPDHVRAFKEAGMSDHVGKPFRRAELLRVIERCCGQAAETPIAGEAVEASETGGQVVDRAILDELIDLGGHAVVRTWIDDVKARIGQVFLDGPRPTGMTDRLVADNHTLISQAGMLGLTALSDACRDLETTHGAGVDPTNALRRCFAEAERAVRGCENFLATIPDPEPEPRILLAS